MFLAILSLFLGHWCKFIVEREDALVGLNLYIFAIDARGAATWSIFVILCLLSLGRAMEDFIYIIKNVRIIEFWIHEITYDIFGSWARGGSLVWARHNGILLLRLAGSIRNLRGLPSWGRLWAPSIVAPPAASSWPLLTWSDSLHHRFALLLQPFTSGSNSGSFGPLLETPLAHSARCPVSWSHHLFEVD